MDSPTHDDIYQRPIDLTRTLAPTSGSSSTSTQDSLAVGLTRLQGLVSQSVQAPLTASIQSLMDAVERRVDAAVQWQLAHSGPLAPQSSTLNPTTVASIPNPPASSNPNPSFTRNSSLMIKNFKRFPAPFGVGDAR